MWHLHENRVSKTRFTTKINHKQIGDNSKRKPLQQKMCSSEKKERKKKNAETGGARDPSWVAVRPGSHSAWVVRDPS